MPIGLSHGLGAIWSDAASKAAARSLRKGQLQGPQVCLPLRIGGSPVADFMGRGLRPLLSWLSHNPTMDGTVKFCTPNSMTASEGEKQHPRGEDKEAEEMPTSPQAWGFPSGKGEGNVPSSRTQNPSRGHFPIRCYAWLEACWEKARGLWVAPWPWKAPPHSPSLQQKKPPQLLLSSVC